MLIGWWIFNHEGGQFVIVIHVWLLAAGLAFGADHSSLNSEDQLGILALGAEDVLGDEFVKTFNYFLDC